MTLHYNKSSEIVSRRCLRKDQTYVEKIVWMYLRRKQLLGIKFKRQFSIDKYVIDFYSSELKLAVEIDGEVHDLEFNKVKDKSRQEYLERYGIIFVRIKNEELLGNPEMAFKRIEEAVKNILNKRNLSLNPSP